MVEYNAKRKHMKSPKENLSKKGEAWNAAAFQNASEGEKQRNGRGRLTRRATCITSIGPEYGREKRGTTKGKRKS